MSSWHVWPDPSSDPAQENAGELSTAGSSPSLPCWQGEGVTFCCDLWKHPKMIMQILSAALETFPSALWDLAGLSGKAVCGVTPACPGHAGGAAHSWAVWVKRQSCRQERWHPRGGDLRTMERSLHTSTGTHISKLQAEPWHRAGGMGWIWLQWDLQPWHKEAEMGWSWLQQPRGKQQSSLWLTPLTFWVHTLNIKLLQC